MSFLRLDRVTYRYQGSKPVIDGVSWTINEGEFHCLVGKSGCGKTTLLKLAAGLLQPDEGGIYLQGEKVTKPSPSIGYVFQAPTLLEWKRVIDNVLLPISLKRKPTKEDYELAHDLLERVGLSAYRNHYPAQLSGGQQSRVAIARALIQQPALLFLDEPFAALDAITREELQDDLLALCRLQNTSVLFITHDIAEAVYLADRIAVMADGDIVYALDVHLPKPRALEMRYEPRFNELCFQVRQAMEGMRR
ncbi:MULTISPECIES: ABC transporter ATP-binding protein [Geobacillus]|jgi:NitT/TauT family transport system ATP-binding protein|uniref:ABC transporter ATP-binding protein n=1 Tax=Geobacillus thermodenitrificans TaxID=33940 RepID=A0ABY9Q7P8_GEOTD|nr:MULTISPECIES: ABC transporter ATP-binding protein [Geobacillus]ARP43170.1 Aliphatic sulfonates import ATP-binding protein SsuB [Geobacillus thermodenitrificans]ATO38785.1 nitrate ABC transporter ATP-binding protein [Geobacillus thermodenitrificans]KQB92962.1 nitrate ABC transporter ATP-binding protein [Geobacillus sp. PA-3]MEC5189372.1 NitT/TauT family transport system ATP-binding protein [Geobacillus thermodenitrificans]MED0662163.1 ABC transporter ATP-binding protein [Geobacillus thermode